MSSFYFNRTMVQPSNKTPVIKRPTKWCCNVHSAPFISYVQLNVNGSFLLLWNTFFFFFLQKGQLKTKEQYNLIEIHNTEYFMSQEYFDHINHTMNSVLIRSFSKTMLGNIGVVALEKKPSYFCKDLTQKTPFVLKYVTRLLWVSIAFSL